MLWTVVYKDANGRTDKLEMEAENRAIVIGNMREQGLQVVNIMDGGMKANARRQKNRAAQLEETSRRSGLLTVLLLALLLAAAGGVAWWYFSGQPDLVETISQKVNHPPQPKHSGKAVIRVAE